MGPLCLLDLYVRTLEAGQGQESTDDWVVDLQERGLPLLNTGAQIPVFSTQNWVPSSAPRSGSWSSHFELCPPGIGCSREIDDFLDLISRPV